MNGNSASCQTLTVDIVDDGEVEVDETFSLEISDLDEATAGDPIGASVVITGTATAACK